MTEIFPLFGKNAKWISQRYNVPYLLKMLPLNAIVGYVKLS
jgi:hypothetical protein